MPQQFDVAIVGAGAAGVSAARSIAAAGRSAILIEGSQRVGGRAWTQTIAGMPLDLGCGWLHSAERNPLVAVAEASGLTVDRTPSAWQHQYRGLGFSAAEQDEAGEAWEALQRRFEQNPPASDRAADALEPGGRWNGYIEALSGYINGTGLADLSIADYLAYDQAASDTNWRVREGYGTLVAAQLPPIAVQLATPVTAIDLRRRDVRLETRAGTIVAKVAIVAVSTAVLASGGIAFTPAIDERRHAAAQLPLGLADKLFLGLADGHGLEPEKHLLGNPHTGSTGSYYLMPFGRPVIECFVAGECAESLERAGLAAAFAFAVDELAALLGSGIRRQVRPLAGSAWRGADGIGGSYSHALPGHASCRAVLAKPVEDRIFFAGEATDPKDFSTAHGAWQSGARAATEALQALDHPASARPATAR